MCRIAFILEEPNQGRFVHREGKAGRFTYEKQSGRASMYRLGRTLTDCCRTVRSNRGVATFALNLQSQGWSLRLDS